MKYFFYGVRDAKANAFVMPHFRNTHLECIRAFGDIVKNEKTAFGMHPEDYSLYHLGEFDDWSGQLESLDVPTLLCTANEFVARPRGVEKLTSNGIESEVL